MTRDQNDFEDDDGRDDPLPEDMDHEDDDSLPLMSCPSCRASIVEDTQQCPHCGEWITTRDSAGSRNLLLYVAVALMLGIVAMWIIR